MSDLLMTALSSALAVMCHIRGRGEAQWIHHAYTQYSHLLHSTAI